MRWIHIFILCLLVSCGQQGFDFDSKLSSQRTNSSPQKQSCPCSTTPNPVCGADGRTYTNSCFANCHGQNFKIGACVTTDCTQSGIVCGQPNTNCNQGEYCSGEAESGPQNYNNDCERIEQNATLLHVGACE